MKTNVQAGFKVLIRIRDFNTDPYTNEYTAPVSWITIFIRPHNKPNYTTCQPIESKNSVHLHT